jgi:hypothetical protein
MPIAFGPLGIGLPEILVILMIPVLLSLPVVAIILLVRMLSGRKSGGANVPSRPCPRCGQTIPWMGSFCCFCGQKTA